MKKQNGFTAVEILLVLLLVAIVGTAGFFVFNKSSSKKDVAKTDVSTQIDQNKEAPAPAKNPEPIKETTAQTTPAKTTTTATAPTTTGYLTIKEWGLKIKVPESQKITYTIDTKADISQYGKYDSIVTPIIKPEFLTDKGCNPGVGIYRSTGFDSDINASATKIGAYYFLTGGAPSSCTNATDEALATSIRTAMDSKNLESL